MRLSVDSDFASGPRNKKLARVLGLHRHHTAGAISEVWAACYIARSCYLTIDEVDNAAEFDGFAEAMIAAGLAERVAAGHTTVVELEFKDEVVTVTLVAERDGLRIEGVSERIDFLLRQAEKSRRGVEAKKERARQRTNPPPVSGQPAGYPAGQPMGSPAGQPARVNPTTPDLPLALPLALDRPESPSPAQARAILPSTTTEQWYRKFSEARVAVALELGIADALPFPLITPAREPRGYRDLRDRRLEEGENADKVTTRVLEALIAQARETKSVDWLSDKAFTEGGWRTVRDGVPAWRAVPRATQKTQRSAFDVLDEIAANSEGIST